METQATARHGVLACVLLPGSDYCVLSCAGSLTGSASILVSMETTGTTRRVANRPYPGALASSGVARSIGRLARDYFDFACSFAKAPAQVGAVCPSSRVLAKAMITGHDLASADAVVELGPGTGVFTQAILDDLGRGTTFVALELDRDAVRKLRRRFPELNVYHDSAEAIRGYLDRHGKKEADLVVSGLPWTNMEPFVQEQIMRKVAESLAPEGVFTAFTYLVSPLMANGRHYTRVLGRLFESVEISSVVWRNVPPAIVYCCRGAKRIAKVTA